MNLAQLETVVWIARLGSFRSAALKLNSAQPTVSMRVKELESYLGIKIFSREHRKVHLTPKGQLFIEYAEQVLADTAELRNSIASEIGIAGRVSIGVVEDIALTWLPELLRRITAEYPRLSVDFQIDLTLPLMRKLELGELDLALIGGDLPLTGLAVLPLGFVHYVWMCKTGLVSTAQPWTPKQFEAIPILTWSKQAAAHEVVNHWFMTNGAHPKRVNLSNSITSLALLTMAGLGVSLLPRELYGSELNQGILSIVPTSPPLEPSPYSAVYKPIQWPLAGKLIAELAAEISTFK